MKRAKTCGVKNITIKFQRREVSSSEHCCVPLCSASAKFSYLSFHSFPTNDDLRKKWLINIRRDKFTITSSSKVCGRHFLAEDIAEPTPGGLRRLKKEALPLLFQWNNYVLPSRLPSVWERRDRYSAETQGNDGDDHEEIYCTQDHDYCALPDPVYLSLELARTKKVELKREIAKLTAEVEEMTVRSRFGLQRFAGSDEDIRFYTRFYSYAHFMAFWRLIEPATARIVRVTRATRASQMDEEVTFPSKYSRWALEPVDELFLFLTHLTLGLEFRDLGHCFDIHPTAVSRIIITWANFLYSLLGSVSIWLSEQQVKDNLPEDFESFPDTQVIIDCTELRCQTPSSLLLQNEMYWQNESHCTMKALVGMAPHGPITFISQLCAGSISDKELFKQSGIQGFLTKDMAVMTDKGLLIDDCVTGKVYHPPFLSQQSQMPTVRVHQTPEIARLRIHVERVIWRVKENKLFDTIIPLSIAGSINQLFTVACLLSNYQC